TASSPGRTVSATGGFQCRHCSTREEAGRQSERQLVNPALVVISSAAMNARALAVALFLGFCPLRSAPQTSTLPSILVKAGKLLDVRKGAYVENAGVWNLMARIPEGPDGYTLNLATKSQAFRALEGAYNARITLEAGFTSVRDVEKEGAGYADVALRDAIEQALAEGPRMQVATRAIAAVGQYNPFGISPDLSDFPTGAQDRKSTRLNSSHVAISYAVFCLKKKKR